MSKNNVLGLKAWALKQHRTTYSRKLHAYYKEIQAERALKNNIAKKGFLQTQS